MITDDMIRAQCFWDADPCNDSGPWSEWQLVEEPDHRIKPVVEEALIEGDQLIRVSNQVLGASLMIKIRPTEGEAADEFGPRPASEEPEIALNAPLVAGNVVTVVQTLCTVSFESDPVTVLPLPPVVHAPVILPPLYECGRRVQVSNLHPGATVRVFQDGLPVGLGWAGIASSISIEVAPTFVAGGKVTAHQTVGSIQSPDSNPVEVQGLREVPTPRILPPVALGDTTVWVSGVLPGSHVIIQSNGTNIGAADIAESIGRVAVSPVTGTLQALATICELTSNPRAGVEAIRSPCATGTRFEHVGEEFRTYTAFSVPVNADGGGYVTPIEGQLYFPATNKGQLASNARNLPLVVIAHGYWRTGLESYKGYDYLAQHLVRWGMIVFSVNMDTVNSQSSAPNNTQQYSRGEIILHVIDSLLADMKLEGRIDRDRIGLVGHSMGGEGVVAAQVLNQTEGRGYGIRGAVSIAPTHWRPELVFTDAKYLQLLGSYDQLTGGMTGSDSQAVFSGFRIYDRAWREKTHFWIYGARHNPFNRVWFANGDDFETGLADISLPPQDHERIATCLINAFFQDSLVGKPEYAGYMEGIILPQSLQDLEIHTQHSERPGNVVDNFGDPDGQVPLADEALNKVQNSLNQAVNAAGPGLDSWEDILHPTLQFSPHGTKGVQISWSDPDAVYHSSLGGIAKTPTDYFSLRVGQFFEDGQRNPIAMPVDLFVTLGDGANEATLRLGSIAQVPYPDGAPNILTPMRTVRLPLDAFAVVNPSLILGSLQALDIRLGGRATGNILVDDLEFSL